jgi:dipeptidyl aminopeptidase/acylaminoacyl peptidase
MKRRRGWGLALTAVGCALLIAAASPQDRQLTEAQGLVSPANPAAGPVPIADLFYSRSVRGPAWSPDGKEVVFSTNFSGRYNLWKVAAQGGWPVQLSRSDDVESDAAWSPDGRWIVFQHDRAGDEVHNLFAIPASGGVAANLSSSREISAEHPLWSPDGASIAFLRKPTSSSIVDIGVLDWRTRASRNLTREEDKDRLWNAVAWSPDGKTLYANRERVNGRDSDVYSIDVASGARSNLTGHDGECVYAASALSRDGLRLLVTSDQTGGHRNVALLDVAGRKLTWMTHGQWDAEAGGFSPDGHAFTYTVNEDGRTDVYLAESPGAPVSAPAAVSTLSTAGTAGNAGGESAQGPAVRIDFPPGMTTLEGNPTSFSPDGGSLLLAHTDAGRPRDLWVYDRQTRQARQLTYSALGSLVPAAIAASQLVHYRSFDGTLISAFLWMPFNLRRDGRNPGIVMAHGGPTGQTLDAFSTTAVALASRGYVVIAPNVRGSTGYGVEFEKSNYKDLGGGDLQDYVYGARFLAATGYVEAAKIGITGGSYGGYMAMMAIGKTPDVWAAAVELFGITDWLTEQEHEDPELQQYDQSKLGDPVKDREVYEKASPIRYFRFAKAPLLVLQGANDVRDPKEEAEQAVTVLKREGKVVDAHYYADEGHGFTKRENQIDALERTVAWFDRYLKGGEGGKGGAGGVPELLRPQSQRRAAIGSTAEARRAGR